jgi:hypothetical protein
MEQRLSRTGQLSCNEVTPFTLRELQLRGLPDGSVSSVQTFSRQHPYISLALHYPSSLFRFDIATAAAGTAGFAV